MRGTTLRDLTDRVLGGELDRFLAERREAGLSYEQIARQLLADHQINVAATTVWRWCSDLEESA